MLSPRGGFSNLGLVQKPFLWAQTHSGASWVSINGVTQHEMWLRLGRAEMSSAGNFQLLIKFKLLTAGASVSQLQNGSCIRISIFHWILYLFWGFAELSFIKKKKPAASHSWSSRPADPTGPTHTDCVSVAAMVKWFLLSSHRLESAARRPRLEVSCHEFKRWTAGSLNQFQLDIFYSSRIFSLSFVISIFPLKMFCIFKYLQKNVYSPEKNSGLKFLFLLNFLGNFNCLFLLNYFL